MHSHEEEREESAYQLPEWMPVPLLIVFVLLFIRVMGFHRQHHH